MSDTTCLLGANGARPPAEERCDQPGNGWTIAQVPKADPEDVRASVTAASEALPA